EGSVGVAQYAGVVIDRGKDVPGTAPWARIDGEARRERERTFFQSLDAEQLVAKRLLRRRGLGVRQPPEESTHRISLEELLRRGLLRSGKRRRREGGRAGWAAGLRKAKPLVWHA